MGTCIHFVTATWNFHFHSLPALCFCYLSTSLLLHTSSSLIAPPQLLLLNCSSSIAPPQLLLLNCSSSIAPPQLLLLNCFTQHYLPTSITITQECLRQMEV